VTRSHLPEKWSQNHSAMETSGLAVVNSDPTSRIKKQEND